MSGRSNQACLILKFAIIFILCHIWFSRNKLRHEYLKPSCEYSTTEILKQINMVGNNTSNYSSISIFEWLVIPQVITLLSPFFTSFWLNHLVCQFVLLELQTSNRLFDRLHQGVGSNATVAMCMRLIQLRVAVAEFLESAVETLS